MASVTQQALLLQGANAFAGKSGWYSPLSAARDTPRRPVSTFNADGAWLAALAFAATGVKGVQWQPPLSVAAHLTRATPPINADGGWIIPKPPAAVGGGITWQQPLSVRAHSIERLGPSIVDPSSYAQAWLSAAASGPLDNLSPTAAYSFSRKLLGGYAGAFYTTNTGVVDQLNDQSGNGRNVTQPSAGFRPTPIAAGPNSIACGDFNGGNFLDGSTAISNLITGSAGFVIVSVMLDTVTLNNATVYVNHGILADASSFMGLFAKNVSGTTPTFLAYNWDGNADVPTGITFSTATPYVLTWRHEGGTVYLSVNGGAETSTASGDTSSLTAFLRLGAAGTGTFMDGKIFECATFQTIPSSAQRSAIIQNFGVYIGAAV